jgi:hypothetical protein
MGDEVSDHVMNGLIVLTVIAIVATLLVYGVLFVTFTPERPLDLSELRPAGRSSAPSPVPPTATPEEIPTYPSTWTPPATATPPLTGTPTQTGTPSPTSTMTHTPTPLPTYTPTPTETGTPTGTPTITATPTKIPFYVDEYKDHQNCYDIGLEAHVFDADGIPVEGLIVEYGEENVSTMRATTDVDGEIAVPLVLGGDNLANAKRSHVWFVRLFQNGVLASETFKWKSDTIEDCEKTNSVQVKEIIYRRRY